MANAVVDAIFGATKDARVRMAMVMGGMLESGLRTDRVGDSGHSFGPFQIYLVAHPNVTAAQAKDPVWASKFMLPAYMNGVSKVPDALWQANPAKAAATAAYYAEHPKVMYGDKAISAGWPTVQAALAGQDISTGGGTGGGVVPAQNSSGGILDPLANSVDSAVESFRRGMMVLANMTLFFAAVTVGALLTAIGLVMLFRETTVNDASSTVRTGAGRAAVAPFKVIGRATRYWLGPKGERGYDYG